MDKEYPTQVESRNLHSDRRNKHTFGKFNRPSKQQKNKATFDVVLISNDIWGLLGQLGPG